MEATIGSVVWSDALEMVRERCSPAQFRSWFANLTPGEHDDETIRILVPNRFVLEGLLRDDRIRTLESVLREMTGHDRKVELRVDEERVVDGTFDFAKPSLETPTRAAHPGGSRSGAPARADGPSGAARFSGRATSGESESNIRPSGTTGSPADGRTGSEGVRAPERANGSSARPSATPASRWRGESADVLASSESDLNPNYSFQHFIVGPSNRVPHAAALAVVSAPGKAYNPLFLHGSVGLGKTHLLQAICHALIQRGKIERFLYLSCETFVNHFISAIENGKLDEFRYLYRHVDMLLIDDVQFLSKKERTQEEFFHTFNTLYNAQKQIVLTCDSPPSELRSIQERLVSRFNWGLVTHLQLPDYETRVAILKNKATLMEFDLPEEVAHFTAERVESNIRDLEGAITKIVAYSRLTKRPADIHLAREAFQDLPDRRATGPDLDDILRVVTAHFGVSKADLQSKRRLKKLNYPRQIAMYLARDLTRLSLEEIGRYFSGRDHTTVIYATDKIASLVASDHDVAYLLEDLSARVQR